MLTLWTGQPGSGKTSGVVEKVIAPLAAEGWLEDAIDPEGKPVKIKRRLLTNINGLLLEHEKIDAADLLNWPEWVKPGDLIVFDEVQKPWPLTGANKEQPRCITELETHRHYGIDMHLLTQHPMLVNAAIARLAGQHFHVRKLGNTRLATLYEWDGVSRTLLYKNAFSKKPWRRRKATEKLYRSSSLHTRQKRALPTVLFLLLVAVIAVAYLGPSVYARIDERSHPKKVEPDVSGSKAGAHAAGVAQDASESKDKGEVASAEKNAPKFVGCAAIKARCTCFDSDGAQVDRGPGFCEVKTGKADGPPISLARLVIPDQDLHERQISRLSQADEELFAFAGARDAAPRVSPPAALPSPSPAVVPARR